MDRSTQATRGERFRALHHRDEPFVLPNPWDIGSARLFAQMGFEALATTGGGRAFTLGVPDGSTRPDDLLTYAAEMAHATHLPVTADLEDGFGDSPDTCHSTILAAAQLGLVGASIEDRSYVGNPRRPHADLHDVSLAAERITAAVEAANGLDFPFTVTARCESFLTARPDLADTIRRLQEYEAAGAHCLYAPGLPTLADIRAITSAVDAPVNVILGRSTEPMTVEALAGLGVSRISLGSGMQRAAMATTIRAARELLEHGTSTFTTEAVPHAQACELFAPWSEPGTPGMLA